MEDKSTYKRTFSEQSKKKMRESALARGNRQGLILQEKIDTELEKIWHELATSNSVSSRTIKVTLADIARRVGIHTQTLHKARNKLVVDQIRNWIFELTTSAKAPAPNPRRGANSAAEGWRRKYNDLLAIQCLWETDLHNALAKVDEVQKENAEQAATIKTLTSELKVLRTKFVLIK